MFRLYRLCGVCARKASICRGRGEMSPIRRDTKPAPPFDTPVVSYAFLVPQHASAQDARRSSSLPLTIQPLAMQPANDLLPRDTLDKLSSDSP